MRTDTARSAPASYLLQAVVGSVALFGLLRLSWTEAHLVLPFARVQGALAVGWLGAPSAPVEVTLACSGADALALCLAAVLAYPVRWRSRLTGAAGGAALILALNTVRIGTLGRSAASPAWFEALHVYAWPAVLTLAIAGYVFTWMRVADRAPDGPGAPALAARPQPSRRFVALSVIFLLVFATTSPLYLESSGVLALGAAIASAAAAMLGAAGITAHAVSNVLSTSRGAFLVTQECISTPLIPVYLAAVCAYAASWRRLALGLLAALPLFTVLAVARLLVVALPPAVMASPLFLVHAFYQLLLGAVLVGIAAVWRHGRAGALRPALAGLAVFAVAVYVLGPFGARVVALPGGGVLPDPQGALAMLPAFQVGLYAALWVAAFVAVGWARIAAGLAALGATQAAGLFALHALAQSGITAQVRDVRGWAVAAPLLIFTLVVTRAATRR